MHFIGTIKKMISFACLFNPSVFFIIDGDPGADKTHLREGAGRDEGAGDEGVLRAQGGRRRQRPRRLLLPPPQTNKDRGEGGRSILLCCWLWPNYSRPGSWSELFVVLQEPRAMQ